MLEVAEKEAFSVSKRLSAVFSYLALRCDVNVAFSGYIFDEKEIIGKDVFEPSQERT